MTASTESLLADRGKLLAAVVEIARRAGAEILAVYRSRDLGQTAKADRSPLTIADLRSHDLILRELAKLTPGVPVLSEEGASIPFAERAAWPHHWLVDPLDGTKEFLSANGEFTVNIALVADHVPQLGVVQVPARDMQYWGGPGLGAWRQQGSKAAAEIQAQARASSPVRVVGSRSHRGSSLDDFLVRLGPHVFVPVGSALKFCLVAEGSADVYPRLGTTMEWDTAAAHAVLAGAGGVVVTLAGEPLRYNAKDDLRNPHFVAYADRSRDWLALLAGGASF